LHIHEKMIDQGEVGDADHGRNQHIENRLAHVRSSSTQQVTKGKMMHFGGPAHQQGH
jgi:hypothetical protein